MQADIYTIGGVCYAPCPRGIGERKVGSYSCTKCAHFGGKHGYLVDCLQNPVKDKTL